jgi:hypothetical protein
MSKGRREKDEERIGLGIDLVHKAHEGGCAEATDLLKRLPGFKPESRITYQASPSPSAAASNGCKIDFRIGDNVQVHSLATEAGRLLNGRAGTVVEVDPGTGRCGVSIDGIKELKFIKVENLRSINIRINNSGPASLNPEERSIQMAIEGSMQRDSKENEQNENAQLSDALVRSGSAADAPRVVLLRFSRCPKTFRVALSQAPELAYWRYKLEGCGFASELSSGANVFVEPPHYEAALEAIRLSKLTLFPEHVIVDTSLADIVISLAKHLP